MWAVTLGGSERVSSGSHSTSGGIMWAEKIVSLRRLTGSVTTELRPTSLPVPAVVGIATKNGWSGPISRPRAPWKNS